MSTNFEEKLFKQQAYWTSELSIDALESSVFLQLVANPDTSEIECDVIFIDVVNVSANYHGSASETKSKYLCSLLGIDEVSENDTTKYIITTDTAEVSFYTSIEPDIKWHNPNKPLQKWTKEIINVKR